MRGPRRSLEGPCPTGEPPLEPFREWPPGRTVRALARFASTRPRRRRPAVPPIGHGGTDSTILGVGVGIVAGHADAHELTGALAARLERCGTQPPAAGKALVARLLGLALAQGATRGQRHIAELRGRGPRPPLRLVGCVATRATSAPCSLLLLHGRAPSLVCRMWHVSVQI